MNYRDAWIKFYAEILSAIDVSKSCSIKTPEGQYTQYEPSYVYECYSKAAAKAADLALEELKKRDSNHLFDEPEGSYR